MKSDPAGRKPRRPPGSVPVTSSGNAAGGPKACGETQLGRMLAQVLAYFEVRTVTSEEVALIRPTYQNGWLRPEIEAKLEQLDPACPDHRRLRRLVTLSLDLLTAVDERRFDPGPAWLEVEPRLLRALAYFIREDDAIPDHLPGGLEDDMREFRDLEERANLLFTVFEAGYGEWPRSR
jgi:hypothetical protein